MSFLSRSAVILVLATLSPGAATAKLPDLSIEIRGPRAVIAGNEIGDVLWLVLRNRGDVTAPGTRNGTTGNQVYLYLARHREARVLDKHSGEGFHENAILPGGRIVVTADLDGGRSRRYTTATRIPRDTPPGRYYLCAAADPTDRIAELDEHNNVDCSLIHVRPAPLPTPDPDPELRAPRQLQPGDGNIVTSLRGTITLRWQAFAGTRYDLEVECRGCTTPEVTDDGPPLPYLTATALKRAHFTLTFPDGHSGRWRVRSSKGKTRGAWSAWQEFRLRPGSGDD